MPVPLLYHSLQFLRKNKKASLLNLTGLTLGLTASLFLALLSLQEFSFDNFHDKRKTVSLIYLEYNPGFLITLPAPSIIYEFLKVDFSEVKSVTRVYQQFNTSVKDKNESIINGGTLIKVDSDFPSMFNFPLTSGDWKLLFNAPGGDSALPDHFFSRLAIIINH